MIKSFVIGLALISTILLQISCDREKLDTKKFASELKEKKIKRVTEGQISANALKIGNLLADTLDILFAQNKCDLQKLPVVASFTKDFDAQINLYTEKDSILLDTLSKQVLQSTFYGIEHQIPEASLPNVQYLRNEHWLYSKPLKKGICNKETSILYVVISQAEIIKKLN